MQNGKLDIIDLLDAEEGFVALTLKSGAIEFGEPLAIIYDEDDEGWETVKTILFKSYYGMNKIKYGLNDIESFIPIDEEDIPPYE